VRDLAEKVTLLFHIFRMVRAPGRLVGSLSGKEGREVGRCAAAGLQVVEIRRRVGWCFDLSFCVFLARRLLPSLRLAHYIVRDRHFIPAALSGFGMRPRVYARQLRS